MTTNRLYVNNIELELDAKKKKIHHIFGKHLYEGDEKTIFFNYQVVKTQGNAIILIRRLFEKTHQCEIKLNSLSNYKTIIVNYEIGGK